jgi:ABC-2 type transport system permease protein
MVFMKTLISIERIFIICGRCMRQIWRDRLVLSLTLVFAPLFIFLYYLITAGGSTSYGVVVVNLDEGAAGVDGQQVELGGQAAEALRTVTYADGQPILRLLTAADQAEAEQMLRERSGAAFLVIPADFTRTLLDLQVGKQSQPVQIIFGGDLTNPYYTVAGVMALSALEEFVQQVSGQPPLIAYAERSLGASAARTEFEIYVPGILVFSIIMLVFLAAMTAARESEAGTLRRLQLTGISALEYLGGMSAALVLVGLAAEFLAFGTALLCGFHSAGPLWVAVLVGVLTSLGVIGTGLVVAAFSRNVSQAFVIANFPLGLFMFFSGTVYPLPRVDLFSLGGQPIGLYDILAPTHAVAALNKVFVLGAGAGEVGYELVSLVVLSVLYFVLGVWLFQRRQLSRM